MILNFRIIAHRNQRYPTVGDYFLQKGVLHFRVSRMKDKRYCFLVWLHEMIEWAICRLQGVKLRDIDKFDMEYEKAWDDATIGADFQVGKTDAAPCGCWFYLEPGDDPHAPYHQAHQTATVCEKLIAEALGVDWTEYDRTVESL